MDNINNKIIFLYNLKELYSSGKKYKKVEINLKNYKNIKIQKNKNLLIVNKIKNNLLILKKYFKLSDEIVFIIEPNFYSVKKYYFIINKIIKYNINPKKIKIIIKNKNEKIYYLIIKCFFKKLKIEKIERGKYGIRKRNK